jgi:acetyl esterase/lipase
MLKTAFVLTALLAPQAAPVRIIKDLAYYAGEGADDKKHRLDLYLPKAEKPFPVLMWIHGGAWAMGDRALFGAIGERFAERGIGCAVISYRLSPGVKHPEHVKDCARAFAWLHANVKTHGGDPDRLFVFGQSAGGHLSALLTLDSKYLADLKVPEGAIKGTVPLSGVYEVPALPEGGGPLLSIFPKAFGSDREACREASPAAHVKGNKIPMLVLTESDDLIVRAYMAFFKAAVEREGLKNVQFADAQNRNHFSIVLKMMGKEEDPVRTRIVEFVRQRCTELDGGK